MDYSTSCAEEHCRKGTLSRTSGLGPRSLAPSGFTLSPKGTLLSAITIVRRHWQLESGGHPSSSTTRLLLMPTSIAMRERYISGVATAVSWGSTHLPQLQDLPGWPTANQESGLRQSYVHPGFISLLPTSADGRNISFPPYQMQPRRVERPPEKSDTQAEILPRTKHSWAPSCHLSWCIFCFPSSLLSAPLAPGIFSDSLVLGQFLCRDHKGMQA